MVVTGVNIHDPLQCGFVSYRGPGAVRRGGAAGEGLDRGGSNAEQVCVSRVKDVITGICPSGEKERTRLVSLGETTPTLHLNELVITIRRMEEGERW